MLGMNAQHACPHNAKDDDNKLIASGISDVSHRVWWLRSFITCWCCIYGDSEWSVGIERSRCDTGTTTPSPLV